MMQMTQTLNKQPLVSIVIPVYNTASFLDECLGSLLRQTYQKLEIICVDDGSTDSSWDILSTYTKKDARISCLHQANQGQSVARNTGLAVASGEYICFLDSDDYLDQSAIQRCVDAAMDTGAEIVLFNMEMFFPDGAHFTCFTGTLFPSSAAVLSSEKDEFCVNFTNAATGFYRREVLTRNALQFRPGMIYEDWAFMVDLMTAEDLKIFWIEDSLYWYRRDFSKSTTSVVSESCLDMFQAYWLSKNRLVVAFRRNQMYINDAKILNESIGFVLNALRNCRDSRIVARYIREILRVLSSFPEAYFSFLCNYLEPTRKKAVEILYQNVECSENENKLLSLYHRVDRARSWAQLKQNGKKRIKRVLRKALSILKGDVGVLSWLKKRLPPSRRAFYAESDRHRAEFYAEMSKQREAHSAEMSKQREAYSAEMSKQREAYSAEMSKQREAYSAEIVRLTDEIAGLKQQCEILSTRSCAVLERKISAACLHPVTFAGYRNKYNNREVVLCGAGPSLSYYIPINDAVFVAINRAFLVDSIKFDYIVSNDFRGVSYVQDKLISYKGNNCIKLFAYQFDRDEFPEPFVQKCGAERFYTDLIFSPDGQLIDDGNRFARDITHEPLGNFWSSAFPALQIILYTNPKRIYLVGIDMYGGHFDDDREGGPIGDCSDAFCAHRHEFWRQWESFKKFAAVHYPETEIVSVNPVALKGIFQDTYTDSFLQAVASGAFRVPDPVLPEEKDAEQTLN